MGDADRVRCATYLFRDDGSLWWKGAEHGVNLATLTWVQFKEIFYEKYFTAKVRGRLKREFMTLRQGDISVAEFVKKFDRGCHFVPLIARDAAENLRQFMDGLRPTILNNVMMMRPVDYATATTYAFQFEESLKDIEFEMQRKRHQHQNNNQPNKKPYMGLPRPQGPQKPQGQVKKQGQQKPPPPASPKPAEGQPFKKCNRLHYGPCVWGTTKYFICKEEGHKAADCPKNNAPTVGREYVMNEEAEEEADTTFITDQFIIVFIDDTMIYSKSKEEHSHHLRTSLQVLQDRKLYAKFSKCEFWLDREAFLSHIISSDGVEVDPSKVETVKEWPVQKTVIEIRSFLGLAGYYRKFIKGFSTIVVPLTPLTKKNAKFLWGFECKDSFDKLKQALISAPVLSIPSG
ncbi:uncharacterized protein [Primulina eburnea]|uniref:uncharacterized protein n=1 Tax=Primulina eburnea TaxID=1245227 RepID=UPI003C6C1641